MDTLSDAKFFLSIPILMKLTLKNQVDIHSQTKARCIDLTTLHSPIRDDNFDENEATHSEYETHSLYPLIGQL